MLIAVEKKDLNSNDSFPNFNSCGDTSYYYGFSLIIKNFKPKTLIQNHITITAGKNHRLKSVQISFSQYPSDGSD